MADVGLDSVVAKRQGFVSKIARGQAIVRIFLEMTIVIGVSLA